MSEPLNPGKENFSGGEFTFISKGTGTSRTFLPGDIIDSNYQLTSLLGRGGMGVVFACHHRALDKDYAIKLLNGEDLNGEYWARFQIEARALAKLNHPAIVGIYNMGKEDGQYPYYVMDLLSGEALDAWIRTKGRLPVQQALDFFIPIADALNFAHLQGIIHRDIKPSNIMLVRDSQDNITSVKLVDFGIARLSKHNQSTQSQTATGLVLGTPFYMSPEQCQGARVDERSDIYSLGCALFETLTGVPPFVGENSFQTFMMHQTSTPPRLAQAAPEGNFPRSLEQAVSKMLAKDLAARYQTMAQVKHDLERIKAGKEIMVKGQSVTIAPTDISPLTPETVHETKTHKHNVILFGSAAILTLAAAATVSILVFHPTNNQKAVEGKSLPYQKEINNITSSNIPDDDRISKSEQLLNRKEGFLTGLDEGGADSITNSAIAPPIELKAIGATDSEIAALGKYNCLSLSDDEKNFHKRLDPYLHKFFASRESLKTLVPEPMFRFPANISLGIIQFDHQNPITASNSIAIPQGQSVCFYTRHATKGNLEILDLFGPDDLTGLEIVTNQPLKVIKKVAAWKKLEHISFFNSLEKALPNFRDWEESDFEDSYLPSLQSLTAIKNLGLCGDKTTATKVLQMPLMRRLHSLRVKHINDIEKLLVGLPKFSNIQELWVIDQATTDAQLEPLTKMKNLRSLRIRRSKLTPDSLKYFKMMPALKELWLDRPWTNEEKAAFQTAIPGCQFESVLDRTYWRCIPSKHS